MAQKWWEEGRPVDQAAAQPDQQTGPRPVTIGTPSLTKGAEATKAGNQAVASGFEPTIAGNTAKQGTYILDTQPTKDKVALVGDLAKRYIGDLAIKKYEMAIDSYARGTRTAATPQGDLSLTYAYAKIMDPDSVVREGEQAAVNNTDTIAGQLYARLKKELTDSDGTFRPEVRARLRDEMRNAMGGLNARYVQQRQFYGEMAKRYGLPAEDVIGPHGGLPFADDEARSRGMTPPKRDFYGNIIEQGRPLNPQPSAAPGEGGPGGGNGGQYENDPSGNRLFLTAKDKAAAAEAQAAFDSGADRPALDAIAAKYGLPAFGPDLDTGIDARRRGVKGVRLNPSPTGMEDAGLTGKWLGPVADSRFGSFAIGAGNAATFGQLGNIAELTGGSEGGTQVAMDLARETNPWSYGIGEITGSLAPTAGLRTALGAGSRFVSNPVARAAIANPIAADMAYGGLYGASSSDDPLTGAVTGAGLAGAGSFLGGKLGQGLSKLGGAFASDLLPAQSAVLGAVDRTGRDAVIEALTNGSDLGVPLTLADVSPEVASLTGAAIRRSPSAGQAARDTLIPRGRGQYDRFVSAVERDLGPVENVPQRSEDLITQARAAAGPLYDQAYAAPGASVFDVSDLMQRPSMKRALGNAVRIAQEEGRDPMTLGFAFDQAGNPTALSNPSWQTLDYVKRGLDDVLEGYRDKTTGRLVLDTEGRAVNDTLQEMLQRVDQANPDYAAARAAYAGPAAEREALSRGQAAVTMSPDQLGVNVNRMTPSQLDQTRLGFQSQLAENAGNYRYSTNPFEAQLGTPAMEQRLSSLYGGNEDGVARLLAQAEMERQAAATSNRLIGNSMTAERQLADRAFEGGDVTRLLAEGAIETAVTGAPVATTLRSGLGQRARDAMTLGMGRRAVERADQVVPLTLQTDAMETIANILAMGTIRDAAKDSAVARALAGQKWGSRAGAASSAALVPYAAGR